MATALNGTGDEKRQSSKKRHLDTNPSDKSERKHKRSKSDAPPMSTIASEPAETEPTSKRERKKHKSSKEKQQHIKEEQVEEDADKMKVDSDGEKRSKKKKRSRKNREEKEKEKSLPDDANNDDNHHNNDDDEDISAAQEQSEFVVLKSSRSKTIPGAGKQTNHQYPFYTQTVSEYLPLYPQSLNDPVNGFVNQHLEPILNRYVPSYGGVLLAYRNPRVGSAPGKGSLTEDSGMDDVVMLETNDYGMCFGWLTVEIDTFRPLRGAWLEGLVNIQSGGHIGVVCWGKFNASIEAERLPRDWRWIDQHARKDQGEAEPEAQDDDATGNHGEVHATGYWVDKDGTPISAEAPLRFRIKNYEVGNSGDYGYLSIEGTMLSEEDEARKSLKEREIEKRKLRRGIAPRRERRPMLELGMTKFTNDDGQQDGTQRPETS